MDLQMDRRRISCSQQWCGIETNSYDLGVQRALRGIDPSMVLAMLFMSWSIEGESTLK